MGPDDDGDSDGRDADECPEAERVGPSRRRVLAALATGPVVGVAGCSRAGRDDESPATTSAIPPTPTTDGEATPTATQDPTPSPTLMETPTATATDPPTGTPDARTPTGPGPSAVEEGGPPTGEGWSLTFRDEFDEGSLDWDTWEVGFGPYNDHHCAAAACARRENVNVDPDAERLVLTTTPEGADEIPASTWLADYTTGAVCTASSFRQTFGYFEAKARLPAQPGALAAFWAWSEDGNPPEIDFYESFGATPQRLTTTVHVDCDGDGELQGRGNRFDVSDRLDDRFHVVGCEWGPEAITWYLDGRRVHRVDGYWIRECHDPEPLFPILNTHVGGREGDFIGPEHVGDPTEADYPYTHEIEWVRVWQRDDWA